MKTRTSTLLLAGAALALTLTGCSTAPKEQAPAPKPAPIAAPAPPAPMAPAPTPPPSFVIEDVHFDFDKSTLKPAASATLDEVASALLNKHPGVRYEVSGFTDSVGSDAYNQGLSERRAKAVADYLVKRGVSPGQLSTRGYGESNPIASNADAAGRAKNRRVEVRHLK